MLTFSVALIAFSVLYYICRYLAHRKTGIGLAEAARATVAEESTARAKHRAEVAERPSARARADLAQQIRAANPRLTRSEAIRLANEQLKTPAA